MSESKGINLNIPLVQQIGMQDCGIASLKMMLDYYGIQKTYDEVKKAIPLYRNNYGSNLMDISLFALKSGLKNEAWAFDHWFMDEANNETPSLDYFLKLEEKVKNSNFKNKNRRLFEIDRVINLLDNGGVIKIKPLTKEIIDRALKEGNLVFLICFSGSMYDTHRVSDYHMIIVHGMTGNNYLVKDPNRHFKLEKINKDKLLAAHHQASSFGILPKGVNNDLF